MTIFMRSELFCFVYYFIPPSVSQFYLYSLLCFTNPIPLVSIPPQDDCLPHLLIINTLSL